MKSQPFSVGVFSCLIAPVPACSWGFLRKPADCTDQPLSPFRATFHSLLAIPRSDLAPRNWPEVRKGREQVPYRSNSYAWTKQAVGLQHRVAKETLRLLLDAGVTAAAQTLADRSQFVLDDTQWQAFQEALDRPVQSKPRLKKLLREPGVLG